MMEKFDRKPKIEIPEGYEPEHALLTFDGYKMKVHMMSLASFARAVRVIEPYVREFTNVLFESPAFKRVLAGEEVDKAELEAEMKDVALKKLRDMIVTVPETVIQLLSCIMNVPEKGDEAEFFWGVLDPDSLLSVVEQLDKLNNFANVVTRLLGVIEYLGRRYGIAIPGITVVEKEQAAETEVN